MADIYTYMHTTFDNGVSKVKMTLRSLDGTVSAGGCFPDVQPEIDAKYEALVKALNEAIDKEAEIKGSQYVTNDKNITPVKIELDYDELMNKFNSLIDTLIAKAGTPSEFEKDWSPRIVQITERYLGKGKKVNQCTRDQVEMLSLIVSDLEELAK